MLGGFALTFLGVLLTLRGRHRLVGWTAFLATTAAALFVLCALGWSLISLAAGVDSSDVALMATLQRWHMSFLYAFVGGIFGFLATLGLSGWLHSRALGIASSAVAVLAATAFLLLIVSI